MPSRLALAACVLLAAPLPARAHAILVDSEPAAGASVAAGNVAFRLHYNSRVDAERSRLTLTAPDGTQSVLAIGPAFQPDLLTAQARLAPGAWSLRWQVLATDGHITRGDVAFTVSAPP